MSDAVSIERDGAGAARSALERCVGEGGVAVFPADTVYGLASDPLHEAAVDRIHDLKGRDEHRSSAVMFFSPLAMRELVATLGSRARDALAVLLPGPVTAVVANPEHRYPLACREDRERLGIRLIDGPLAGASCALFQTSANPSGEHAPRSIAEVDAALLDSVDLVIDAGSLPGTHSTVVDLTALDSGGGWRVLREGALPSEELERRLDALSG